ncbi:MAG: hypothetical protein K9L85_00800 [Candidatus Peribacteraceae bacterium]|nr:hypothetical protein [Candidatus Peribacteraceae bacterium]
MFISSDQDRKLPRMDGFDYSAAGIYFITICTANREKIFGEIRKGKMILNPLGKTVWKYWRKIPRHFLQTQLDAFVVMPDHVHGVVWIGGGGDVGGDGFVGNGHARSLRARSLRARSLRARSQSTRSQPTRSPFARFQRSDSHPHPRSQNKNPNLSVVVGSFKSAVTKIIRRQNPDIHTVWQKSFHDRIIRNEAELKQIRDYIRRNPKNWVDNSQTKTNSLGC